MTRLLFLPTEHTLLWLEEPRAAGQLVEEVRAGRWLPPPPYAACLPEHPDWAQAPPLVAVALGELVIVGPGQGWQPPEEVAPAPEGPRLTPRQRQVLQCLVDGLDSKQIAHKLGISRRRVFGLAAEVRARLGVSTPTQAAGRAVELGLVRRPGR